MNQFYRSNNPISLLPRIQIHESILVDPVTYAKMNRRSYNLVDLVTYAKMNR